MCPICIGNVAWVVVGAISGSGAAAFVFFAAAPPVLLLFATVDLAGALWTWWALRRGAPGTPGAGV